MAGLLASALLLTGCAQSVDPIERLGKKAAEGVRPHGPTPDQSYRRWGLTEPLARPPRPAARALALAPQTAGRALPRVVDHVPTRDRVVFLTYDDGAEKDPRFVDMVRELRLPVSVFLTDTAAGPDYGHFARLRELGAGIQNHTLDHRVLAGLPYAGQRAEICGQQARLRSRLGARPRLFRPPYASYDTTTLRAAADCGISALVLWRAAMTPTDLVYPHGKHHLRPGDIILVGPDETTGVPLQQRTTLVLRRVQQRGLTVGRLEDYL
ncbi:polysaccharide deacetylase [Streptomyces yokosukanensis]|uniref:Polysaccharide deacetylase n=1 Tax=Streptomyces yokosukanensis TaxID=67386 RepID=A0A101PBW5_9ACTN|nr:polysaccharide deacetylase family protein [Streptomyces yokosukanensis]KUN08630.1 polysaccharide deacetylase [Streptomyces yokosukanensis]